MITFAYINKTNRNYENSNARNDRLSSGNA